MFLLNIVFIYAIIANERLFVSIKLLIKDFNLPFSNKTINFCLNQRPLMDLKLIPVD